MLVLAFASAALELTLAAKIPAWRRAARRNKAVNLTISIFLSFIIGLLFGAAGLIVMSAAVLSTVLVIPGYAFLEWAYDSPQASQHEGNLIKYYTDKWKTVILDFTRLIYKILRILTFPIWFTRDLIRKYQSLKLKLKRT